ncbi:MAG: hypothetical protein H7X88_02335, partial [Gloeobacteraceae cyanobacterium ES-bin-316]|nr:hypothetical protein [Ferruginibacter sp.]
YKLSKFNFTMDMMGQQTVYDSEKPSDEDSEMGKAMAGKIGKPVPVTINKNDGSVSMESSAKDTAMLNDSSNPLDGIMQSFGAVGEDATVSTAFFIVPKEKKAGDSWVDSNLINKMREIKTYTIKSVAAGITTIGMFSTLEGTSSVETQGMQMDITLSGKTEGEILVDVKSSLVKKRSSVMDLTGSIDMMGQSIPMTSKAIVNISYN